MSNWFVFAAPEHSSHAQTPATSIASSLSSLVADVFDFQLSVSFFFSPLSNWWQHISTAEAFEPLLSNASGRCNFVLKPHSNRTVVVRFQPSSVATAVSAYVVRNNLTVAELIRVNGETARFTFGLPKVQTHWFPLTVARDYCISRMYDLRSI